jgi:type II secretory pathway component GspD/PulD (secretin)
VLFSRLGPPALFLLLRRSTPRNKAIPIMRFRSLSPLLPLLTLGVACQSSEPREERETVSIPYSGEAETEGEAFVMHDAAKPEAPAQDGVGTVEASAPSRSQGQQDYDADADQLARRAQQRDALSRNFTEQGQAQLERGDLQGALGSFSQALQWLPSNEDARAGLRTVQGLLGDQFAGAADLFDMAAEREAVRRAQARMAAEQALVEGDNARRQGDLAAALAHYHEAEVILRYHPLVSSGDLNEGRVRASIESTLAEREFVDSERRAREQADARAEVARAEEAQRRYREDTLRSLYTEANAAFQRENYTLSQNLAKQILVADPGNEYAIEMRDLASDARHRKVAGENRRNLHEQWLRTFEDLDSMPVPQTQTIVFDDLKRWNEVRQREPISFSSADAGSQAETQGILAKLDSTIVSVRFGEDGDGAPLADVADYLERATGVNFVISNLVRDEVDEDETSVNLDLPDRSVRKLLDLMAEMSENLRWKVSGGVVKFVTAEELIGGQELRFYDVRDLIQPVRDFPGREINVIPSGGIELPEEDLEEREALVVTGDSLDTLIRDNLHPASWDADPNNTLQVTESGTLVVNQTPEVHAEIEHLLQGLREATGIMVDIQARFLKVEDNFLEDIGVDFRGLGAPGVGTNEFFNDFGDASAQSELGAEIGQGNDLGAFFDDGGNGDVKARLENLYDTDLGDEGVLTNSGGLSFQWTYLQDLELELILRAVSKSERIELVTAPKLLVHNTARANLTVLNQIAYIYDYDVEIAQAASIADPQVEVIEDGVILDVRPVVSADRRYITLEMRPTVAELVRPIPEFTTSLGGGTAVTIQLPELEISRVRTSVPMPDGATVLLGGMKIREERKQQSGIPILNKIPFVSFLFERKGQFVTSRKLLILLKAKIVIPSEHEPTRSVLGAR